MAMRVAKRVLAQANKVPCTTSAFLRQQQRRALMSSGASNLFSAPSFPVQPAAGARTGPQDPTELLEKYSQAAPMDLWRVGNFPLPEEEETDEALGLSSSEEIWDMAGMLTGLNDDMPLRDSGDRSVDELLDDMERTFTYQADSVVKKRRKKMNKHKHRKRRKAVRYRTKKN